MSFKNVRLPKCVEVGATGGPGFRTTIIETLSGDEYRNIDWSRQRGHWDVGYTDSTENIEAIIAFFQVMRGQAYGFRFRDWSDYKVDNLIGVGDGEATAFQAVKVYFAGEHQFVRRLTRLESAAVVLLEPDENDVIEHPASPTIDMDTGLITFAAAPEVGWGVKLTGSFDVPVRFAIDELPITMLTQKVARIDSVPLVEIRDN